MDWVDRPNITRASSGASGDVIQTDGRVVTVVLQDCDAKLAESPEDQIAPHGNLFCRLVRREILSLRNDVLRDNLYWRTYEGLRWAAKVVRWRIRNIPKVAEVMATIAGDTDVGRANTP